MVFFREINVKQAEDKAKHCRSQAVAEAPHSGDHSLDDALLVRRRVHGDERANGRIGNAAR